MTPNPAEVARWINPSQAASSKTSGSTIHVRSTAKIDETKAMLEGKQVQLTSQPRPLTLPNGPVINYFYVAGPNGTRIEIVERPGLTPGQ